MINNLSQSYVAPVYEFMGQPIVAPYNLVSRRIGFSTDTLSLKRHTIEFMNHRWEATFMVAPQNSGAILSHIIANQFKPFDIIIPQPNSDPDFIQRMRGAVLEVIDPVSISSRLIHTPSDADIPGGWSILMPTSGDIIPIASTTSGQPFSSGFDSGFWGVSIVPPYSEVMLASPVTENIPQNTYLELVPEAIGISRTYAPGTTSILVTSLRFMSDEDKLTGRLIKFSSHTKVYIVTNHGDDGTIEIFPPLMNSVSPDDRVRHWDVPMRVRYNDEGMTTGMTFSDGIISDEIKISLIEDI